MDYHDIYTDLEKYASYLHENTPLSEKQAKVLALRKMEKTNEEISDQLGEQPEAVEYLWDEVVEQWNLAQYFCGIMGPHPWDDGKHRKHNDFDDSPWRLLSSGTMSYPDEERTRMDLELYDWGTEPGAKRYLLIEREISDTADYSTKTTEQRSVHGRNGLHDYIFDDVDNIDEYYLRLALMVQGGVNPDSDFSPLCRTVLGRDPTDGERAMARSKAMSKVSSHWD